MPITWRRPSGWSDIEQGLALQLRNRGDALVSEQAALQVWQQIAREPFFASAVLESHPPVAGHTMIGFGCSIFLAGAFADAELAHPRPDINSRLIASLHAVQSGHFGQSVLLNSSDVAKANAQDGVDVLVLCGGWRGDGLSAADRQDVQMAMITSFTTWHSGYRIRRILWETSDSDTDDFAGRSVVYRKIAEFPEQGRTLYCMSYDSVKTFAASVGNVLFSYREPVLRLRESDRQLLSSALDGATDPELAASLGITFAAVKARWRSTFARISETMPSLVSEAESEREGRGLQKRHRVLAYMRNHLEELRPYDWKRSPQE